MPPDKIITVRADATIEMIHDDQLCALQSQGAATITRASFVEPGDASKNLDPLLWYADLAPIGGSVLGGFDTRERALAEEVAWINRNHL